MICLNCRNAGDANVRAKNLDPANDKKLQRDELNRSKAFHAMCKDTSCMCQHRVELQGNIR